MLRSHQLASDLRVLAAKLESIGDFPIRDLKQQLPLYCYCPAFEDRDKQMYRDAATKLKALGARSEVDKRLMTMTLSVGGIGLELSADSSQVCDQVTRPIMVSTYADPFAPEPELVCV